MVPCGGCQLRSGAITWNPRGGFFLERSVRYQHSSLRSCEDHSHLKEGKPKSHLLSNEDAPRVLPATRSVSCKERSLEGVASRSDGQGRLCILARFGVELNHGLRRLAYQWR